MVRTFRRPDLDCDLEFALYGSWQQDHRKLAARTISDNQRQHTDSPAAFGHVA